MNRRAVITGMGVVSCLGHDLDAFWQGLIENRSGIDTIDRFDPDGLRNERAGQVRNFDFQPADFGLDAAPDLATQFLLVAAREALGRADIAPCGERDPAFGAVYATNFGGSNAWEEYVAGLLEGEVRPGSFQEFAFGRAAAHACEAFGIGGPCTLLSVACASGAAAIGAAVDMIRVGEAEAVLVGCHDALAPTPLSGLSVLRTMTDEMIRPFSADRSGTLFGEGGAALVIEELGRARERGADIGCEVLGWAENNNAYHITAPDQGGAGMTRVVREAIEDAGVDPATIDYVNAHGTGTQPHDPAEVQAIKAVLGERAWEIPVSSIKGAVGHMMGAAGAAEAIATAMAITEGIVPPTLNYREPDPECDLDHVPNESRPAEVSRAISISAGIGGNNACVVLGAVS
ncbi:MAG: beta-ketoacyl-[acyl-carrier-protein] synthase family protein [Armatimonadota bacterium]|nr:beta-ketoacyl-[acyl-carrier-protein] synthase family protein [Armatimonadota bacterium]